MCIKPRAFFLHMIGILILVPLFTGCNDDGDDPPSRIQDAGGCVTGETRCGPQGVPLACEEGRWTEQQPCGRWSYCNFGACEARVLDLPLDESPHNSLVEWWYFTGHLFDESDHAYGFELTFFLFGEEFRFPVWMIHAGVVNEAEGTHTFSNRLLLEEPPPDPPGELRLYKAGQHIVREGGPGNGLCRAVGLRRTGDLRGPLRLRAAPPKIRHARNAFTLLRLSLTPGADHLTMIVEFF